MAPKGFLKTVIAEKRKDIQTAMRERPMASVIRSAENRSFRGSSFLDAMKQGRPGRAGIIAEIKKASPSKGDIRPDLDPAAYARHYTHAGASAISVLTETHFFKGSLADLSAVREVTGLPVLRKDFILSEYQIYEAAATGADAVLLIVSILSRQQLKDYVMLARETGMEPLVEIHSEWELEHALFADARVIGINNRNLETLETDTTVARRVVPFLTPGIIPVAASGISRPEDIQNGRKSGIHNFLVGESIVRADDTEAFIRSLKTADVPQTSNDAPGGTRVKICGLTRPDEATACADLGVDAIGLVFYEKSPRHVTRQQAMDICRSLPETVITTGVFVDAPEQWIMERIRDCRLKAIQLHGSESPERVSRFKKKGVQVFKALFSGRDPHLDRAEDYPDASAILAECGKGSLPGGNAESWDWSQARKLSDQHRLILAGGIHPGNVAMAVSRARPWAVDVSSGVETRPGRKSIEKVRALMDALQKFRGLSA